jgi:hypothetical protein
VDDRVIRSAARGLVVAAIASAIAAAVAARLVLGHGSGTYLALHIFLPLLVLPGVLVWRAPRPAYIAAWSLPGLFTTMVWSVAGTPYRFERELVSWSYVITPVSIAIVLVCFGAPLLLVLATNRIAPAPEGELLALRLRRIVMLVFVIATIVAVTAFEAFGADGVVVAVYTATVIAPGLAVQAFPRPLTAWLWTALCVPFATLGVWLWLVFRTPPDGPAHLVEAGLGTIYVLVMIALPFVCLTTRQPVLMGSSARASYRRSR